MSHPPAPPTAHEQVDSLMELFQRAGDVNMSEAVLRESLVAILSPVEQPKGSVEPDALTLTVRQALATPGCERLKEWAEIGPVQRAAVEQFALSHTQRVAPSDALRYRLYRIAMYGSRGNSAQMQKDIDAALLAEAVQPSPAPKDGVLGTYNTEEK